MKNTIEKVTGKLGKQRIQIKNFKYNQDMHKFLNKGDNANHWHETDKELKNGKYVYAGGQWLNVKSLDACELAHI